MYSNGIDMMYDVEGKFNSNLSSHEGKSFMQYMSDMGNNPITTASIFLPLWLECIWKHCILYVMQCFVIVCILALFITILLKIKLILLL